MKRNMEKCESCENKDREKSNENWMVCSVIPVEVMIYGSSADCKNFVQIVNTEDKEQP